MYKSPESIKMIIIFNILELIETNDPKYQIEAITKLKELGKYYTAPITGKSEPGERMPRLKEFILNANGYNETIPNLYRSLI